MTILLLVIVGNCLVLYGVFQIAFGSSKLEKESEEVREMKALERELKRF